MRIISEDETERIVKCSCCGTRVAYMRKEIVADLFGTKYIGCPVCKNPVLVSIFDRRVKNEGQK